jgi:hypothetical protein
MMMIPKFKTSDLDEMKAVCRPLGDGAPMTCTDPYPDSDIPLKSSIEIRGWMMRSENFKGYGGAEITGMAIR